MLTAGPLVRLCHHGWVISVVAAIGRSRGARLAPLRAELEVARPTLARALEAADALDLVLRNPGYGHPLRPEILLTPWGEAIAPACQEVRVAAEAAGSPELARRKWTLPVLALLASGAHRFATLQHALDGCTPRALARTLDDLEAAEWIERHILDERPPRPEYGTLPRARALGAAAVRLARRAGG